VQLSAFTQSLGAGFCTLSPSMSEGAGFFLVGVTGLQVFARELSSVQLPDVNRRIGLQFTPILFGVYGTSFIHTAVF